MPDTDAVIKILTIVSIVSALITTAVGIFVAWVTQKTRADMGELKLNLLDRVDQKLGEYVSAPTFEAYMEAHAREHLALDKEVRTFMTRHQDWKHWMEPWVRGTDMKLEDMAKEVDRMRDVRDKEK